MRGKTRHIVGRNAGQEGGAAEAALLRSVGMSLDRSRTASLARAPIAEVEVSIDRAKALTGVLVGDRRAETSGRRLSKGVGGIVGVSVRPQRLGSARLCRRPRLL